MAKGLRQASGYMRTQLAKTLNLRMTPELTFIEDASVEHGARIAKILENIEFHDEVLEENEEQ